MIAKFNQIVKRLVTRNDVPPKSPKIAHSGQIPAQRDFVPVRIVWLTANGLTAPLVLDLPEVVR